MEITIDKERLVERFLRYVAVDTQSDPESETFPSTAKQLTLLNLLLEEMLGMGMSQAPYRPLPAVRQNRSSALSHTLIPVLI